MEDHKISKLLEESEARFRSIADITPVLIWMAGPDKRCYFFNKGWLDFTGRTPEQEAGNGWIENIHPDDLQRCLEAFNTNFDARREFDMEYRLRRHDGQYRWISGKGAPQFNADAEFSGFVSGCMDVHEQKNFATALEEKVAQRTKELKESEAFLQSVLNTTQNLIYIYDLVKQKIVFINKKAIKSTGYTADQIMDEGRDLFSGQIHPDDIRHVRAHRDNIRALADGKMAPVEFRLENENGGWTHQLSRDVVFRRDNKGKVTQYIGVSADITDFKKANEMLVLKNEELEHSNAELASFSSIASHDLKEPLRKIQMFSKLILDNDKQHISEKSITYLDRVIVSANRMQQLIDDLISYSRNNSGQVKLKETDLKRIMEQVLEDLQETIEESGAVIETGDLPVAAIIPSQFRQLFHNLISNAIKYSRAGVPPRITISLKDASTDEIAVLKGDPERRYCKILVADNGIGFSNEHNARIFEPFKRLHGKDEYSGTGIGLAICKKIMANHQGFITASGEAGKGSVFSIYLGD